MKKKKVLVSCVLLLGVILLLSACNDKPEEDYADVEINIVKISLEEIELLCENIGGLGKAKFIFYSDELLSEEIISVEKGVFSYSYPTIETIKTIEAYSWQNNKWVLTDIKEML